MTETLKPRLIVVAGPNGAGKTSIAEQLLRHEWMGGCEYPLPAIREALLNAVIHRNYTDGSDIQIKIFDDQLSIFSPGLLYGGLKLDELKLDNYKLKLRNKLVAEAFYLTGNIEKYGSGFIRIRKALLEYPEVSFKAEEMCGGVCLTFTQKTQQVTPQVTPQVQDMLVVMQGEVTRQQLMEQLGLKDRKHFAAHYLQPGIAQGAIELTIPDKPNSRLQKYRLTQAGKVLLITLKARKQ